MTINRRKKVTKYRGSKTHGCGSMKKRRGAGHRGGRGAAGSGKRADSKKPSIWKGKYFGKFGFTSKSRSAPSVDINVGLLDQTAEQLVAKQLATKEGDTYVVDLTKAGFTKLLGEGKVSGKFKVTVASVSPRAKEKIEKAGGQLVGVQAQDAAAAREQPSKE